MDCVCFGHGRATDVQVEFVMLDPYVRRTLHHHNKVLLSSLGCCS